MAGLLDFLFSGGQGGGVLGNMHTPDAPPGLPYPPQQFGQQDQPSPLDTAQWPHGPIGAPSQAMAQAPGPQAPGQYSWMPPQPQKPGGLVGGIMGFLDKIGHPEKDSPQYKKLLLELNREIEQQSSSAALIDKQPGLTNEQKRFFASNPEAWKAYSTAMVSPNMQIAPSGDVIQSGPFGKLNMPVAVPISEKMETYDPATGRMKPAFGVKPSLVNPQGGMVQPQMAGQPSDVAPPPRAPVQGTKKWWGDGEAQAAGLYDKPGGPFTQASPREAAESKGYGETLVDQSKTILNKGMAASKSLSTLQRMSQLNDRAYEGDAAPAVQHVRSILATFGVDPGKVPAGEEFKSLSNKLTMDALNGSLGTGVSNADVSFIQNINPNLSHTIPGRRELIETATLLAKRDVEVAKKASEYRNATGSMDGFDVAITKWAEQNPLFAGREHAASFGDKFSGGTAAAQPKIAPGRYTWNPQKGLVGQ